MVYVRIPRAPSGFPLSGGSAVSCELGGEDRRTLFLCMCSGTIEQTMRMERLSAVHTLRVDVPGIPPFGRV